MLLFYGTNPNLTMLTNVPIVFSVQVENSSQDPSFINSSNLFHRMPYLIGFVDVLAYSLEGPCAVLITIAWIEEALFFLNHPH